MRSDLAEALLLALYSSSHRATPAKPANAARREHALRVLIAEDLPANQAVLLGLLKTRGCVTVTVSNGREALAAVMTKPFDVVLMDVRMPELDGFKAAAAIRAQEKSTGARLPIIAVTAHAMPGDRERCLESGMDAYLSKPIRSRELFETIDRLTTSPGNENARPRPPTRTTNRASVKPAANRRNGQGLTRTVPSLGGMDSTIAGELEPDSNVEGLFGRLKTNGCTRSR